MAKYMDAEAERSANNDAATLTRVPGLPLLDKTTDSMMRVRSWMDRWPVVGLLIDSDVRDLQLYR